MVWVNEITSLSELDTMSKLEITYENWETKKHIQSYASMGIYRNQEWIVKIKVMEKEPLRTYTQNDEPVYLDSAVEFFLNMEPEKYNPRYLNFEVNANGALLTEFGKKNQRVKLKQITDRHVTCMAEIDEEAWTVLLRIPLAIIEEVYGKKMTGAYVPFTFNLYKISECKEHEHYISYSQIENEYPDFHLPQFFERGMLDLGNENHALRNIME